MLALSGVQELRSPLQILSFGFLVDFQNPLSIWYYFAVSMVVAARVAFAGTTALGSCGIAFLLVWRTLDVDKPNQLALLRYL